MGGYTKAPNRNDSIPLGAKRAHFERYLHEELPEKLID